MTEPEVGERRASTEWGEALFGDSPREPPSDATWSVEEWDGTRWRKVGTARGERERDRLLHPGRP